MVWCTENGCTVGDVGLGIVTSGLGIGFDDLCLLEGDGLVNKFPSFECLGSGSCFPFGLGLGSADMSETRPNAIRECG